MAAMTRRALLVGNSDGIGLALTDRLLADGWQVTGLSRSPLERRTAGERYLHVTLDVNEPAYRGELARLWDARGPFELVVHLVGVGSGIESGPDGAEDLSREARTVRTNLVSLVELVEELLPRLVARGEGHLVGLSSIADRLLVPDAPSYVASKAAYSSYLRSTAKRVRRTGVAVTNVRFGFVDTKLAQAPVKPMEVTPERAAEVLVRGLRRRPDELTFPRTMGLLVRVARAVQDLGTLLRDLVPR